MGGNAAGQLPYQSIETSTKLAPKYEALLGFSKGASEYAPFQALSRQAGTQAKMIEGMTSRPSWSSMYKAFGVAPGTDLTPYIQAMRTGTQAPQAPILASPAAGDIPAYKAPYETAQVGIDTKDKKAAQGGLMSLRKYAPGGKVKTLTSAQMQAVTKYNNLIVKGETPPSALVNQINNIEKSTGRNVSPYVDSGTAAVGNSNLQDLIAKAAGSGNYPKGTGTSPYDSISSAYPQSGAIQQYTDAKQKATDATAPGGVPLSQAMNVVTPFYDPTGQAYNTAVALQQKQASGQTLTPAEQATLANSGAMLDPYGGVTNPVYRQALDQLRKASEAPETIGQGAGIMSSAASKLMDQSSYTPQQVQAERANAATMQAAQFAGSDAQAAQANRGDIRDINAQMANVERMQAAMMQAPTEANVKNYRAAQAQLNQMQGPKSWTDPGVAQQYMNPYQQAVTDQAKYESQRDYLQNLNALRGGAAKSKAYGGTRQAMQEAEAMRGQMRNLSNIEAQGLNEAYKSGMQQFSAEQGLGLQAGQANLSAAQQTALANQQATNQQRQQYVNNALQAAMQSYGGQLTAEQQNQVAANAASQFNAQSQNTAYNNYAAQQLAAQQANQAMDWNAVNLNTQNQQAVNLANQQYGQGGFQTGLQNAQFQQAANQLNAQNQQQTNLANQQAALQAAIQNQQAGLTGQGLNLQALNQAGQMGQGLGSLGTSTWNLQQNIPQMWGAAGQTVQNIAQQAATGAQQTAQNWWGGMGNAYQGPTNLILGAAGQKGTQNVSRIPQ